jgi:hypothetical protein
MRLWMPERSYALVVMLSAAICAAAAGMAQTSQPPAAAATSTPAPQASQSSTSTAATKKPAKAGTTKGPKGLPAEPGQSAGKEGSDGDSAGLPQEKGKVSTSSFVSAAVLTLLICIIEIPARSKAGFKACFLNWPFPVYAFILVVGNCVATLLSSLFIKLPGQLIAYSAFLSAFFGVFAFQVIMSNTNITFLGKGVLTIDDWISKARDYAIAAAIQQQTQSEDQAINATARELTVLDEGRLGTYMEAKLGAEDFAAINVAASRHGADAKLYKALAFAKKDLASAINLVRDIKKEAKRSGAAGTPPA